MPLTPFQAGLARLRDRPPRNDSPAERPRTIVVADSYGDVRMTFPGVRPLARVLVLGLLEADGLEPRTVSGALAARPRGSDAPPEPVDLGVLTSRIVAELRGLPTWGTAGPTYVRLQRLAGLDPAALGTLVTETVQGAHRAAVAWKPPKAGRTRPPLTPEERMHAHRARVAEQEAATVAAFLASHLPASGHAPGDRLLALDLYAAAEEWMDEALSEAELIRDDRDEYERDLEAYRIAIRSRRKQEKAGARLTVPPPEQPDEVPTWAEAAAEHGWPPAPRWVGRRRFYVLAAETLGDMRRSHGARFFVFPTPTEKEHLMDPIADEILNRAARIAWEEQRETLLAFMERRTARASATGTDGATVTDLAARRAVR